MTYWDIGVRAAQDQLEIVGLVHPGGDDHLPKGTRTLVLLGPLEPGFWAHFRSSPEIADTTPDPLDRWSGRVISALAEETGGIALFPFGGPPHQPFIAWALRSGRAWQSPAGLLVHDHAGLLVSYRGALALPYDLDGHGGANRPCDSCAAKPCLTACPTDALNRDIGYDTAACHGHLDRTAGADCLSRGCAARRACSVSREYGRLEQQSAFHMRSFHP
ncbi:MAG: ferredoxin [Rhodobacteraceae bacterium]|nr:ferredoxin [Paracoccaceae bacterium]